MNASTVAPLVFSWDPPRKRRRALIVFLILSVTLHALCFYIFQIVYPPNLLFCRRFSIALLMPVISQN
ncbi:MAG: hypothetical protein DME47_09105 [Verrucomicrobia bacterium]|nr:MAG: hypothetical protein DME47_09105 [Verrucomicrobiota bacterium]